MTCERCAGRGEIEGLGGGIPCPYCRPVSTAADMAWAFQRGRDFQELEIRALRATRDRYQAAMRKTVEATERLIAAIRYARATDTVGAWSEVGDAIAMAREALADDGR